MLLFNTAWSHHVLGRQPNKTTGMQSKFSSHSYEVERVTIALTTAEYF